MGLLSWFGSPQKVLIGQVCPVVFDSTNNKDYKAEIGDNVKLWAKPNSIGVFAYAKGTGGGNGLLATTDNKTISNHLQQNGKYDAKISEVTKNQITIDITLKDDSTSINKGIIELTGFTQLPREAQYLIMNKLEECDAVKLIPDPKNRQDKEAIKAMFEDTFIGWVAKSDIYEKKLLFKALMPGRKCKANFSRNLLQEIDSPEVPRTLIEFQFQD